MRAVCTEYLVAVTLGVDPGPGRWRQEGPAAWALPLGIPPPRSSRQSDSDTLSLLRFELARISNRYRNAFPSDVRFSVARRSGVDFMHRF